MITHTIRHLFSFYGPLKILLLGDCILLVYNNCYNECNLIMENLKKNIMNMIIHKTGDFNHQALVGG